MRNKQFVLDPNIYISYFISRNQNYLATTILRHKIVLVICNELIAEFKKVLEYPRLGKYNIDKKLAIKFLQTTGTIYKLNYPIKRYIPQDENDDYLIALALQTSSGFITSEDDDILSEKINLERKISKVKNSYKIRI
jgi:putative PIN family toxin of toxin-antitoxin system